MNSLVLRLSIAFGLLSLFFILWVDMFSAEWYISVFSLLINLTLLIVSFKRIKGEIKK
ncbi:Uncharacterised protein [Acholeplasma oculi]|uniref:Uncharacterized protein n=1 Tax=Acholeplasma oculi TaxID=35623 RepID=A0A061AFE0_9MOLU|nr:hypothetical protein [Acholeplasma oculi]CDR30221.1 hypothetical protein Aocu_01480 [Acholeplasma oculi]SKC43826.1 hypothetical protein SAMN02745122_1021 [Acholeplasma oculi]SUT88603.1 Uncharacterised protein [Acholeplasma oculi]